MTNSIELRLLINQSGIKYKIIAQKLGISYQSLKKKIDNDVEFKASEISAICLILNINNAKDKEKYFFAS